MRISQKLTLLFLLTALIPIVSIGMFSYFNTQKALAKQIQIQINNTATRQINKINDLVVEDFRTLAYFVSRQQMRLQLQQYNQSRSKIDQEKLNALLTEIRNDNRSFRRIHLLNTDGIVVGSSDERFVGQNYHNTPVFQKGLQNPDVSLFFTDIDKKLGHYLVSPILFDSRKIGIALIEYQVDSYLLITQDYVDLGKTGESYLIRKIDDKQREYLTPLRFAPQKALESYSLTNDSQTKDYRGQDVQLVTRDASQLPWQLVVKIDDAEIYLPAVELRNITIIAILVTSLGLILLALYFARFFTAPIITLTNKTRLIMGGDLNQKIEVKSTDEIGTLGTAFNQMVSNLKTKIDQLHDERIKLEASINSLSVGYIMVDRNNTIVSINHTARQTLCASANSPLATIQECTLNHIEDELQGALDLRNLITRCFTEKQALMIKEVAFQNRFLKIMVTPIITIGVIGAVVLIDDITEAKILERSKDEFFSIASHELRTPLTAIRGNISMIKDFYGDKIKDPAELSEMVTDIHESSVRLIGIVNDFLDMSRLEQGKMDFKKEPLSIPDLITSVLKEYEVTGSQNHVSLEFQPSITPLPQALGDVNKAKQVFINMIGNSLKFTTQGKIVVSTQVLPGFIKIFVSDTGRGISLANQNLLFRKFQQANTSLLTRDTTKGTGLGLYISKLLAEKMGGVIKLEHSVEGQGTTFSFSLPIATQEQLKQLPTPTIKIDARTGLTQNNEIPQQNTREQPTSPTT